MDNPDLSILEDKNYFKTDAQKAAMPVDKAYLLEADAQALLETAPDLDTGLQELSNLYSNTTWDDENLAKTLTSQYATKIKQRFKDYSTYDTDTLNKTLPVALEDIQGEGDSEEERRLDQINKWEDQNNELLPKLADADFVLDSNKLSKSLAQAAMLERRKTRNKDITFFENYGARFADGLLGFALPEKTRETLRSHIKMEDSFVGDVVSGLGTVTGAIGAGLAGGVPGAYAYLGAQGARSVYDVTSDSYETTGEVDNAAKAAAFELGSQAIQTVVGGKIFGNLAKNPAVKKSVTGVLSTAVKSALAEGSAEGAGRIISNVASNAGLDKPLTENITEGAGRSFAVGALLAGGTKGIAESVMKAPAVTPLEATVPAQDTQIIGNVIDVDAPTINEDIVIEPETGVENGSYVRDIDGNLTFIKKATGETQTPFDASFVISPEVATKLSVATQWRDPEGNTPLIYEDKGKVFIKSEYLNENLKPTKKPTGNKRVEVQLENSAAQGLHILEINRPRGQENGSNTFRSFISKPIRKAIEPGEALERGVSRRNRTDNSLTESIRRQLGTDTTGYDQYYPLANKSLVNFANDFVKERGAQGSIEAFLATPIETTNADLVATGELLFGSLADATAKAEKAKDFLAAEKLALQATEIDLHLAKMGTHLGQGVQAFNIRKTNPKFRKAKVFFAAKNAAAEYIARTENIKMNELTAQLTEIAQQEEQLKALNDKIEKANPDSDNTGSVEGHLTRDANARDVSGLTESEQTSYSELQNQYDSILQEEIAAGRIKKGDIICPA